MTGEVGYHTLETCSDPTCEEHESMHKILIGAAKNSGKKDFADGVHYGQDEKYEIKVKRQRSAYDCGQTCLEMLGYRDVREMYPNRELENLDLLQIAGSQFINKPEGYSYTNPHMLLVKNKSIGNHWVIRIEDKIICPLRGVYENQEFKRIFVDRVLQTFKVPHLINPIPIIEA
ncbi:MAG: hypothetical protein UU23_C0002G0013 [Candidatus Curtissbacteria bacterium GW2011_GWA1_40_9]|uniref:Peptidase C39 domain-containing protein n=1 Tax=Candidatus Curtissbacteria bacterium GW2011_GWA1_40_9 TaxID=1618408 RepID=A0A0G0TTP8_9BACT|nr:MAG: hypothetical protein UU23_C0002G0013 [Candidatus Curtissbacteria bacterium GW2011_GWA1_40_9]